MTRRLYLALAALLAAACASDQGDVIAAAPLEQPIPYADAPGTEFAPLLSPTPRPAPRAGVRPRVRPVQAAAPKGGAICGDARLVGQRIAEIDGRGACGIARPVKVTSVAGVQLTAPVRINCETAIAFADWVERSAKPAALATRNVNLKSMRPVASYACRTRNHRKGARLSEHAKGNAVDIAEFTFADGRDITVLNGWRGGGASFLKSVWKGACGPFGTVLGPNSDRFHQDHFHFDIARHRGGPYCR